MMSCVHIKKGGDRITDRIICKRIKEFIFRFYFIFIFSIYY